MLARPRSPNRFQTPLNKRVLDLVRLLSRRGSRVRYSYGGFRRSASLEQRKKRRRLAAGLAILVLVYLFVGGDYGIYKIFKQKRRIAALEVEIQALKADNIRLQREVSMLEHDPSYIEKIARERYGMKKEDEIIYKVSK